MAQGFFDFTDLSFVLRNAQNDYFRRASAFYIKAKLKLTVTMESSIGLIYFSKFLI